MTRRNFGAAAVIWQVIWPILFYSLVTTVFSTLMGNWLNVMWIMALSAILTAVVLYYFYSRRRQQEGRHYGPSWRVRLDIWQGAALIFVLAVSTCIFLNSLIEISGIVYLSDAYEEVGDLIYGTSVGLQVLAAGFAAPIVEELIFRGMGYGKLRCVMGIVPAALISSLLFGVYHGNVPQALYAFCVGMVLALIYEHFDGLFPAIWFHISANLMSILLTVLSGKFPSFFGGPIYLVGSIIVTGILAAGCFSIMFDRRRRIRK